MIKKSQRDIIYQVEKNKSNSKTIILLHALALNKSAFDNIIQVFLTENFNIINIELRGHGDSSKEKCNKEIYIEESVKDVSDIIKQEEIKNNIFIIGHSLGAVIAINLVAKFPKRFRKLVISHPLFRSPLKDQIINACFLRKFILIGTYINCILSRVKSNKKYYELTKYKQSTANLFSKGLAKCVPKEIYNISDIIYSNNFDLSEEMKSIKMPVLIIGGSNDFLVNRKILNKINMLINNSVLNIYPGDHVIIYNRKNIWIDIIKFINE